MILKTHVTLKINIKTIKIVCNVKTVIYIPDKVIG